MSETAGACAGASTTPVRRPWAHRRVSTDAATVGLVLVLVVLTVFSVGTAVINARAAEHATRSAAVSDWSDRGEQALLIMEDHADELATESDTTQETYQAASDELRRALVEMGALEGTGYDALLPGWLELLEGYQRAVEQQVALNAQDRDVLEQFEETHVDPYHDALEHVVEGERDKHWDEARNQLAAVSRSQQVLVVATPVMFGVGLALLALFTSVLARSRRETLAQAEQNRHQALHDALTGLPNRVLLADRFEQALRAEAVTGSPTALLLLDLDRFKEVNDTLGHHVGDGLLQQVGPRLAGALRATDTVARLGGDEFAVLLPAVGDLAAALDVALTLQSALAGSFTVEQVELDVEVSIGVVLSGQHGCSPAELVQRADIAMYAAKRHHLGVTVYDPDNDGHTPQRLALLGDLRRAVTGEELFLHFQPKVSLHTGQVCGAEALVRWQHPERGTIAPDQFIPLAEGTGLMGALTRRVLDLALAQARRWADAGTPLQVAVNLSARNLLDDRLDVLVHDLLLEHGVAPDLLQLEVTESAIMTDPARARTVLERLHALGIALSIDDFGAGYTSLGQLKDLPVTELKVDRSFVATMATDARNRTIVRSVVELGHNLGLTAVAEGVEDATTLGLLEALGCDVAQGYHLSRPLPARAFDDWRAAWAGGSLPAPVVPLPRGAAARVRST